MNILKSWKITDHRHDTLLGIILSLNGCIPVIIYQSNVCNV